MKLFFVFIILKSVIVLSENLYITHSQLKEVFNYEVIWQPYLNKVILHKNNSIVICILNEKTVYYNQKLLRVSNPVLLKDNCILIPIEILNILNEINKINQTEEKIEILEKTNEIHQIQVKEKIENEPIKYIILDAGHGGKDPGALGQKGLREKTVTLFVALKVKEILEKHAPSIKVILTRDKDKFVGLKTRARIANKYNSSGIFISIHANASYKKKYMKGYETYILSPEATDEDARALAALENSVIEYEEIPNSNNEVIIKKIIGRMIDSQLINESYKLADCIQAGYQKYLPSHIENRGIKKAMFYILNKVTMVAVLTEIGFITNLEEEKNMRNNDYLTKVAKGIAYGILKYLNKKIDIT